MGLFDSVHEICINEPIDREVMESWVLNNIPCGLIYPVLSEVK